jgi:hypothetical protein
MIFLLTAWEKLEFPGRVPAEIEGGGTAAQISANKHCWEDATNDFKTYNTVQSALKKQIITVVEPMYIEILNDDLFGFANTTSRDMLDHLFLYYGSITAVDIEQNFENMLHLWYRLLPQAEITLNLLRASRLHPQLSATAHYHGLID